MIGSFSFIEQELGEDALVGHIEDDMPFGDIAAGQRVYRVDIFKFFKRLDTCLFLQNRCRR